ncbi:telomeric repeat-binding factor 2-interacting protein 1 [Trematomus bernacchii]|uniref:telomeric repeat-binding factor 2-interacting protein 1 n=1 Tax=Trematomus bernacchii TaxID=40690 RepID=UPI00146ADB70|nr:telomeric repeat-binding factor 2-interacting protein 1 [Trematomus bernacchii]
MASTKQDAAISDISPVLFLTVDGEPMSFFLRPGPVKCKLQPLIAAGGGILSNVQRPGAILLIDPEENVSIPETTAHCYVSTQYIHDCIEKEEQLNLEDYRLNPEVAPRQSPRLNRTSRRLSGGRIAYTAEDDAAISSYVSKHQKEVGGNRLWQEMEKQNVTKHSWQSMKYRYKVCLANKQPEVLEVKAEEATKSVEGDLKIDAQPIPAEDTQPESPKSISPEKEVQLANPQSDEQPAESTLVETVEAETNPPQPEGPCLDPHTDDQPIQAESTETIISPEKEMLPEDSPPAQPESLPGTPLQIKPKEKQKASPKPQQPQRRPTRWHLVLEGSPEPYGKKLRSAIPSRRCGSSPQLSEKSKSPTKSAPKKDKMVEQPPSKKARGSSVAAAPEEPQEESAQAPVSETAPTDAESNSVPQEVEKKKEKRKLGILELAIKEFEDESESDEDVAPDLQNPSETPTIQPPATEPPPPTADTASTLPDLEHGADLQENTPDPQASSSNCPPETGCPEPAAAEGVRSSSKAHLFIFDSETQEEEDSQSVIGPSREAPSRPEAAVNKDAAFSLTQVQLEEDKQRIKKLMKQTGQDLISVTKALLRTSGDVSAALEHLLNPSSALGPLWCRSDDGLLLSDDPGVRQKLQEKYSEQGVAKRVVFLEVEG